MARPKRKDVKRGAPLQGKIGPGDEITYLDATFICTHIEFPYTTKAGDTAVQVFWQSECPTCFNPFEQWNVIAADWPRWPHWVKRCEECRKGQRETG